MIISEKSIVLFNNQFFSKKNYSCEQHKNIWISNNNKPITYFFIIDIIRGKGF